MGVEVEEPGQDILVIIQLDDAGRSEVFVVEPSTNFEEPSSTDHQTTVRDRPIAHAVEEVTAPNNDGLRRLRGEGSSWTQCNQAECKTRADVHGNSQR